jgi:NAD(P)-dependent dehydrogenase (short-subunit alcohol dehydrogenase family)
MGEDQAQGALRVSINKVGRINMGRLDNKVAIITASAQGMGRASVLRFVQEGALVVAADINKTGGEAVIGECKGPGKAVFQHTDLTREDQIVTLIARAVQEFGRLNVVFNVAGNIPPDGPLGPFENTTAEGWDKVMALTLRSVFLMVKHSLPQLRKAGGGSIINVASVAGFRPDPYLLAYSAAKAGVINLTQAVSAVAAKDFIRVNCICPGWTNSPSAYNNIEGGEPAAAELLAKLQPIPRAGRPEDIAALGVFLAGDESGFITGAMIPADGGQSAMAPRPHVQDVYFGDAHPPLERPKVRLKGAS